MPLDETGAWVPDLQPPSPAGIGVAAAPAGPSAPNLPLDPIADPTGATLHPRPLVQSPTAAPVAPVDTSKTMAAPVGSILGLAEPGNIDLSTRPQVKNADGSVSTVRSASFNIDGKEVLLPTVSPDGKLLTDDQAVDLYMKSGQHLGKFDTPDNATRYAQALHNQQANLYGLNGPPVAPGAPTQPSQAGRVIPMRRPGAPAQAPGGGIPGQLGDLDKQIGTNQAEQEAALTNQGDVASAGLARESEAKSQAADIQRQQAADLAAQQQYVRDRQAELNEVDRQNLEQAKNKTIPDFWAGREGEHVGASIGVLLAGLGAGFLGSTQNQAVEVIQHNTDKYFDRKKEEIDNLYKYAQAQGLVNDKARDQYAKSITDLIQQHAAVLDAAKARVEAVATESQSDDAKARAAVLAKQLGDAAAKEHLGVADARIKWYDAQDANKAKLMEGRAALMNASANLARERATVGTAGTGGKLDEQAATTADNLVNKDKRVLEARKKAGEVDSAVALLNQPGGVDGVTFKAAIDGLYKSYTGAAARPQAIQSWLTSIGGAKNDVSRIYNHYIGGGEPTAQDIAAVTKLATKGKSIFDRQEHEARAQIAEDAKTHPRIGSNPALLERIRGKDASAPAPQAHPQDSEAVAWAKGHPADPRAAQILKANGL